MKKNIILWSFFLILLSFFMIFTSEEIKAKEVSTNDFAISVGKDNVIWPSFEKNEDDTYTLHFGVEIKGTSQEDLTFSLKSEITYFINDEEQKEIDELDNNGDYFSSQGSYTFDLYDEDMPSYVLGESHIDKIYFQFTFECISNPTYTYAIQVSPLIELEVQYDYTKPVLCENENECNYLSNNSYLTEDYQFKFTASDDVSGVDYIKYFFSTSYFMNINKDKFVNQIVNGGTFSYQENREYLINYGQATINIYLYVLVQDNASNYLCICFNYLYLLEEVENNLIYNKENSSIPNTDNYYKSINIKIDVENDLYYGISYYNYLDASSLNNSKYLYDKEKGIEINLPYTCEIYVFIVSFGSDDSFTFMILRYKLDNTAPTVTSANYPDLDLTYKKVTLNFQFSDNSGTFSSFYQISSTILEDLGTITNVYENGTDLIVGENLNGEYYIYFAIYDALENVNWFYLHYIFDNLPPVLTLSISEQDALQVSNGKSIKLTLNELKGTTFKCKWALDNLELSENDLDATCNKDSYISAPNNSEGYYRLWAYLEDDAGNSTLYHSYPFLIDSKGPIVEIIPTYNDTTYRETNLIDIKATDTYTGVSTVYYKWLTYDQNITSGTSVNYEVIDKIDYPSDSYGVYALWVYAIDGAGNATLYKDSNKYYVDTEKYNLSLIGKEKITIVKNEKFVDPGVKALKGERKVAYQIESDLDISKTGVYTITYKLDNLTIERKVEVTNTTSYYLLISISTFLGLIVSFLPLRKKKV